MTTTDPRLSQLLSEVHILLTMFSEIVQSHSGRASPMIDGVRSRVVEYLDEHQG